MSQVQPDVPPPRYSAIYRHDATPPPRYSSIRRINYPHPAINLQSSEQFYQKHYSKTSVKAFSFVQIVISMILIVSKFIGMKYPFKLYIYGSPEVICAVLFAISGVLGIRSTMHTSRCAISAYMIVTIVCSIVCFLFIAYSIQVLNCLANEFEYLDARNKHKEYEERDAYEYEYEYVSSIKRKSSFQECSELENYLLKTLNNYGIAHDYVEDKSFMKITLVIFICHLVIGLVQAGLAIVSFFNTCKIIFCLPKPARPWIQISNQIQHEYPIFPEKSMTCISS